RWPAGPSGQAAAVALSSENAAVVPAPLEYRTASVDSTVSPTPSTAATWRRAVRIDSLGNVPLHRSSVGWVSPLPPGSPATVSDGATSASLATSPANSAAEGSLDGAGALGLGVRGSGDVARIVGFEEPLVTSWRAAAMTAATPT